MAVRYLAIDPGGRRTGLAVGDDLTGIATPVEVIATASESERLRRVGVVIAEHRPDALVVGLPLNMDGSEGPGAKAARGFAGQLEAAFGLPVHLADERLSSDAAEGLLGGTGLTHKKKKEWRDAVAAAAILRGFLDGLR